MPIPNAQSPAFSLELWGGGTGSANISNTFALNQFILSGGITITSGGSTYEATTLLLSDGDYYFSSAPNFITRGLTILGQGMANTTLIRAYTESRTSAGLLTWSGGPLGGGVSGVDILAGSNTSGGCGVSFLAGSGVLGGYQLVRDVDISFETSGGTGHWSTPLYVDGTANTTSGGQGWRDLRLDNVFLFRPDVGNCAYIAGATNLRANALWADHDVEVTGGASSTTWSNTVDFDGQILGGFIVGNAQDVVGYGTTNSLIINSAAVSVAYFGIVEGGSLSWTPTDVSGASLSLTVNVASFVQLGKVCTIAFDITFPINSSVAVAAIGGLPVDALPNFTTAIFPVFQTASGATYTGLVFRGAAELLFYTLPGVQIKNQDLSGFSLAGTITLIAE